jgi:septal ring factor EnvC (AmiA/AmiB activator)
MKSVWLAIIMVSGPAWAVTPSLTEKLDRVRNERFALEKALIEAEKVKKSTEDQLKRLKALQQLQSREKNLTEQRLKTLEKYLGELQTRKTDVNRRLDEARASVKKGVSKIIHPWMVRQDELIRGEGTAGENRVRQRIFSSVIALDMKEIEGLRIDLADAEDLESRIEQEKQQISSLMQDVSEQESLIRFHQKIREDLNVDRQEERMQQLEDYRRLKASEVEIEQRITDLQGRQKIEEEKDLKKRSRILTLKPKSLPWPLKGKLVGSYGQHRDEKSGLSIFRKGIEILTMAEHAPVVSVLDGRVQFAGEIPGKGKVMIVEHPDSIYSIYGGLENLTRSAGEEVKASEKLGYLESDKPLYFEIRSKNVAIDPVRWLQ